MSNWYVTGGTGAGSHTGLDWSNAWALSGSNSINWTLVQPGDTIYLGCGVYNLTTTCVIGKSGTAGNIISILAANSNLDGAAVTGKTGWTTALDTAVGNQVVITAPTGNDAIYINNGLGSYLTIDGRVAYGILIKFAQTITGGMGIEIDGSTDFTNQTFRFIQIKGPNTPLAFTSDSRAMDFTPGGNIANITLQHIDSAGYGDAGLYLSCASPSLVTNSLIEYCSFHDHDVDPSVRAAFHPNELFMGAGTNWIFRYNKIYNIGVEGLFWGYGNPATGIKVYRNIFYNASVSGNGRGTQFDDLSRNNAWVCYNNTFVDTYLYAWDTGVATTATFASSDIQNNIYINTSANNASGTHDYNLSDVPTGETHGVNSVARSSLFTTLNNTPYTPPYDLHLLATSPARNKGINLGAPYNVDMDGNIAPASGAWDVGAYQFPSGGGGGGGGTFWPVKQI
jgi:hypothetical protein